MQGQGSHATAAQRLVNTSGNYIAPIAPEQGSSDDSGKSPTPPSTSSTAALYAYATTATTDAAADSMESLDDVPQEIEGSVGGNQTLPNFPTAPPLSSSTVTFHALARGSGSSIPNIPLPRVDLNMSALASPSAAFLYGPPSFLQTR
jgi:hypothetical protein